MRGTGQRETRDERTRGGTDQTKKMGKMRGVGQLPDACRGIVLFLLVSPPISCNPVISLVLIESKNHTVTVDAINIVLISPTLQLLR